VDDPVLVGLVERLRDLPGNGEDILNWNGTLRDPIGERRPFDEFHDQRAAAVGLFQPIDLRNVGMVQRSERFRFVFEPREPLGIMGKRVRESLDGHLAPKVRIERAKPSPLAPISVSARGRPARGLAELDT